MDRMSAGVKDWGEVSAVCITSILLIKLLCAMIDNKTEAYVIQRSDQRCHALSSQ